MTTGIHGELLVVKIWHILLLFLENAVLALVGANGLEGKCDPSLFELKGNSVIFQI